MEQLRIKTYIINLPGDTERRESITREISKIKCLEPEFIDAIDGRILKREELGKLFDLKKSKRYQSVDLAPGEIGCTLSHFECYKKLLASELDYALVMEDDAGFIENGPFDEWMEKAVEYVQQDTPVVLQLFAFFDYIGEGKILENSYKVYKTYKSTLATVYLINRQAANMIVSEGIPYWIADDWGLFRRKGIHTYALYPSFVYHKDESLGSSIGWTERRKRKRRIPRSWLEFQVVSDECIRLVLKKLGIIKHMGYISGPPHQNS